MSKLKVFVPLLAMMLCAGVDAQKKTDNFMLSVNYGYRGMSPELNEAWPIRQDVGFYTSDGYTYLNVTSQLNYITIAPEFFFFDKKISLSPGFRLISLDSGAQKENYQDGGYFYLKIKSEGTNTEYARVRSISESTTFLAVPVDVKYIPFSFEFLSIYVKLSAELGYSVGSSTDIEFRKPEMDMYETPVLDGLNLKRNPFFSSVSAAIGMTLKPDENLYCSMDVFLPSFYMTDQNSRLAHLINISGVQLSVAIPLSLK